MKNKDLLAVITLMMFLFTARPASAEICGTPSPTEDPQQGNTFSLEFINYSGSEIKGIFISETGRDIWSENLLDDSPLKNGDRASLDINRENRIGLADIKIIYSSGKEKFWEKLPILEIFEITDKKDGEPGYERIKLGA